MQFRLSAEEAAKSFKFALLTEEDFSGDEPVTDRDGNTKPFNGRPAYRTGLIVTDLTGDSPRQLTGTTVKIHNKPNGKVTESLDVKLTGEVIVTPWVNYRNNNALCYSIVADGIAQAPVKGRSE